VTALWLHSDYPHGDASLAVVFSLYDQTTHTSSELSCKPVDAPSSRGSSANTNLHQISSSLGIATCGWKFDTQMDSPDTPTDMPRDPDVRLPENILPIPRNTLRLGIRAITQATLTVLVQVLFYALTIICILVLVSFLVECSGWLRETKRRHEEQKVSRPPRASSKAPRMPRHSDGSQCRSVISELHSQVSNHLY